MGKDWHVISYKDGGKKIKSKNNLHKTIKTNT